MKTKKILNPIISIVLVCVLFLTMSFPVHATVSETQTASSNTASVAVTYEQSSSYTITIPKKITLDSTKTSDYEVSISGDIASNQILSIIPDSTFTMSDQSNVENTKPDVIATVTQDKTEWTYEDLATVANGLISATSLSAGSWSGNFYFNINVIENEVDAGTAYAVYCEDDQSLTFYKTTDIIEADATYNGKAVSAVYTGFEEETYINGESTAPWNEHASEILTVTVQDEITPISTASWFAGFKNCTSMDLNNLNTANVTNMSYMFGDCWYLTSIDASNFNTENVTNMEGLFYQCFRLIKFIGLNNWDTSNVTNMSGVFFQTGSFDENITFDGINSWNTANVETMDYLFSGSRVKKLDLSGWNTSKVTTLYYAFGSLTELTTLDISSWNTSNVTDMEDMFIMTKKLTVVYVGDGWTTANANTSGMFDSSKISSVTHK